MVVVARRLERDSQAGAACLVPEVDDLRVFENAPMARSGAPLQLNRRQKMTGRVIECELLSGGVARGAGRNDVAMKECVARVGNDSQQNGAAQHVEENSAAIGVAHRGSRC